MDELRATVLSIERIDLTDSKINAICPYKKTQELFDDFERYHQKRTLLNSIAQINKTVSHYRDRMQHSLAVLEVKERAIVSNNDFFPALMEGHFNLNTPFQIFSHAYIPDDYSIINFSDLEGNYDIFKTLLNKTAFIERLNESEKVCISILGDFVDRGADSFKLVEFFCWLKNKEFFQDKLFLFAGTHELDSNQHFNFKEKGLFYSTVIAPVENGEDSFLDDALKKSLSNEYFKLSHTYSDNLQIKRRYEGIAIEGQCISYTNNIFDKEENEIANRILLYEKIKDLFDFIPLSGNAGNQVLLSHSGAFSVEGRANKASFIFPDFYSGILSFARNGEGRYLQGNSNLFLKKQAFHDLVFSEVYRSDEGDKPNLSSTRYKGPPPKTPPFVFDHPSFKIEKILSEMGFKFSLSGHQSKLKIVFVQGGIRHTEGESSMSEYIFQIGKRTIKIQTNPRSGKLPTALQFRPKDLVDFQYCLAPDYEKTGTLLCAIYENPQIFKKFT